MSIGAIAGTVIVDGVVMPLADARALAGCYAEALTKVRPGSRAAKLFEERRAALAKAAEDATRWRRAGGWRRPEDADQA